MNRQYAISERAHFMCPNMMFSILAKLAGPFDETAFRNVLEKLANAHPFLKAVMAFEDETGKLFYNVGPESRIRLFVYDGPFDISGYESIMKTERNIFTEGLLEVRVYRNTDNFEVLFSAHHLLTDGRGLLQLAEETADCYAGEKDPVYAEERLIADVSELPEGSEISGISKLLIKRANKQWAAENHSVDYDTYLSFERDYHSRHDLRYVMYDVDDRTYAQMCDLSHSNGFTVNDFLLAEMFIRTGGKKIIIAADIRDKIRNFNKGSLGNYSTALSIVSKKNGTDPVKMAGKLHKTVRKAVTDNKRLMLVLACYFEMNPRLLDAAAIAGLGGFESKAAAFVGGGMFGFSKASSYSITNLGRIENKNLMSAVFIPPASPAAILTLGVVTVNGKMYACSGENIEKMSQI